MSDSSLTALEGALDSQITGSFIAGENTSNFVNPKLALKSLGEDFIGVIARSPILQGETLVVYGGGFVDREHMAFVPSKFRPYFYQVAEGIWYGHGLGPNGMGVGERINHSCDPNSGFSGLSRVVSIRDIKAGEPVTLDYAVFQSEELEGSCFDCRCGSKICRGRIEIDDWSRIDSGRLVYYYSQPYIQAKIDSKSSLAAREFSNLIFPGNWHNPISNNDLGSTLVSKRVLVSDPIASNRTWTARERIKRGEVVSLVGGRVLPSSARELIEKRSQRQYRPFIPEFMIAPQNDDELNYQQAILPGIRANLSRVFGHFLVANRDISRGEPLSLSGDLKEGRDLFAVANTPTDQ